VQRLEWADQPERTGKPLNAPKSKVRAKVARDNAAAAGDQSMIAESWAREVSRATARRAAKLNEVESSTFDLRVLPCQDQKYKDVGTEMVHLFKMADNRVDRDVNGAAEGAEPAPRVPHVSDHYRHLQRSLRQTQQYKRAINQAAATVAAASFDPVQNFSSANVHTPRGAAMQLPLSSSASRRVRLVRSARNVGAAPSSARRAPLSSRAPGAVAGGLRVGESLRRPLPPPPADFDQLAASLNSNGDWPKNNLGTMPVNWALAARTGQADRLPQVVVPPSQSGEILMSSRNGPVVYRFSVRCGRYLR
jgi:hypothetical protein